MRFVDAAVRALVENDVWRFELRKDGVKVAERPARFVERDGQWRAEATFGPFPKAVSWDEVVLCSASGVEDPDPGEALMPMGRVYRHSIGLEAV